MFYAGLAVGAAAVAAVWCLYSAFGAKAKAEAEALKASAEHEVKKVEEEVKPEHLVGGGSGGGGNE